MYNMFKNKVALASRESRRRGFERIRARIFRRLCAGGIEDAAGRRDNITTGLDMFRTSAEN